jgi:hypothetical protein
MLARVRIPIWGPQGLQFCRHIPVRDVSSYGNDHQAAVSGTYASVGNGDCTFAENIFFRRLYNDAVFIKAVYCQMIGWWMNDKLERI